jgi:hypothetical protein
MQDRISQDRRKPLAPHGRTSDVTGVTARNLPYQRQA